MKRIEHAQRTIKIGLASLLVVMILALGGLALTNASTNSGISTLLAGAHTPAQLVAANNAANNTAIVNAATSQSAQASPANTAQQQTQQQTGVVDARYAARLAGPAVVTVVNTMQQQAAGRGRFGNGGQGQGQGQRQQAPEALGSGIIIDSQGDIVTNQHVVANQQSLQVIFADGTQVAATLVGADAYSDLAVIKVNVKVPAVAQFGDSDKLEAGQPVVAIGTALGSYNNTVTEGIVSAIHRQLGDGGTSTQNMIQTDAAINHGNSGGPLLDLSGNVIGINTAVVRSDPTMSDVAEGLGFAIPSNTAKSVAEQLMKSGSISHPYIGVTYQVITPAIATNNNLSRQQGVYVTSVASGSPAERAGIQPDSIITRFDGVDLGVGNNPTLAELVSKHKVGDSVKMTVVAPGASAGTGSNSEKEVTLVLGERPSGQ